ncbi:MAG: hypothetical protein SVU69_03990 [Pseudomonadota bacterium]|nr:hypothetical protein [Pseudomonadota bacterium]
MDPVKLYQGLRQYLRVSYDLSEVEGSEIDVGEDFAVKFRLTNDAPSPIGDSNPIVVFKNPRIVVSATDFATPLAEGEPTAPITVAFDKDNLRPGEFTFAEVKMRAIANMGGLEDTFRHEQVAKAKIYADLDLELFFQMRYSKAVFEEIHAKR